MDAVPGRPGSATPGATRDWALYWRNRHLCFGACSLGHEQFRNLTSCARLSPEPGGRDLAEVALADLAMTRPETVRPHLGRYRLFDLFSNLASELGAPLRNRTVDLLLTMHAGFVRRRPAESCYGTSGRWSCLAGSGSVCRGLGALSLGLSLAPGLTAVPR